MEKEYNWLSLKAGPLVQLYEEGGLVRGVIDYIFEKTEEGKYREIFTEQEYEQLELGKSYDCDDVYVFQLEPLDWNFFNQSELQSMTVTQSRLLQYYNTINFVGSEEAFVYQKKGPLN